MNKKIALALVATLAVAAFIGALTYSTDEEIAPSGEIPPALSEREYTPPEPQQVDPVGTRRYENATYHFSLSYPDALAVREYEERENAMSVTFESSSGDRGIQIYITPFSAKEITRERFLLDSPSGVMNEPTDVIIDGVRGTMFFGRHSLMGETREVWFIRNGYLYEVATYKELDSWLGSIMATWKFAL